MAWFRGLHDLPKRWKSAKTVSTCRGGFVRNTENDGDIRHFSGFLQSHPPCKRLLFLAFFNVLVNHANHEIMSCPISRPVVFSLPRFSSSQSAWIMKTFFWAGGGTPYQKKSDESKDPLISNSKLAKQHRRQINHHICLLAFWRTPNHKKPFFVLGRVKLKSTFLTRFQIPNWQKDTGDRNKSPYLFASFSVKKW